MIIGLILAASVGLGFVNEYRAERAAQALHSEIRHTVVVVRSGRPAEVDVFDLVPGDVVRLQLGDVVPADVRLLDADGLACDEAVLTGESLPVDKTVGPVAAGTALADLTSCALMGTVVHGGAGTAVVVATGKRTELGRITAGLGEHLPETAFQVGLRRFSVLLLTVALALTTVIFGINLVLHRPLLDAALFSLAIAVGITPQLLPAVVSTSLATGSRRLARRKVLVKRLVCIEDLGDMDVLITDKTGTLTDGTISYQTAVDSAGKPSDQVFLRGLLATEETLGGGTQVGGNPLDSALRQQFAAGSRVVAVASRRASADLGLASGGTMTGTDIDALDDAGLTDAATTATIFARVSPQQKARLVRLLRQGHDVGFLGDGVGEGRRIFANTIQYVLMGTSSNAGSSSRSPPRPW